MNEINILQFLSWVVERFLFDPLKERQTIKFTLMLLHFVVPVFIPFWTLSKVAVCNGDTVDVNK